MLRPQASQKFIRRVEFSRRWRRYRRIQKLIGGVERKKRLYLFLNYARRRLGIETWSAYVGDVVPTEV